MIRVFVRGAVGGNPVPLVADARHMSTTDMQAVAAHHGHESAFVLPASRSDCNWRLRFFVPEHEMEMCGHATVGTMWALRQWGHWTTPTARVETLSGVVDVQWDDARQCVWISQPPATSRTLDEAERQLVAEVLGLPQHAARLAMHNASTSRIKTLVALPSVAMLDALRPDFARMAEVCNAIDSTGLYPYAPGEPDADGAPVFHARQFPRASGYPEDAATGIAAAALWGYLTDTGPLACADASLPALAVRQGDAMGSPSEIRIAPRFNAHGQRAGCWLSGQVEWSHTR